jgi:AcrR family transcriptional regulator
LGTRKKEALIQFNKEHILASAKKLFETQGIVITTVDEIAKEADCSKSTLYVYFKSKEDILHHIILEQMTLLKDALKEGISKAEDFEECYFSICNNLVKLQEQYPVYYDLILGTIRLEEKDIEEKNILYDIYVVGEEINDIIKELLERGIERGYIRKDIQVLPTIFCLWASISETVRFADQKQKYFKMRLGMTKAEYMEYSFHMILRSIKGEKKL